MDQHRANAIELMAVCKGIVDPVAPGGNRDRTALILQMAQLEALLSISLILGEIRDRMS